MSKYKLGILEDKPLFISQIRKLFIDDFYVEILDNYTDIPTVDKLIAEINKRELDVLIVDYKLSEAKELSYDGDDVMREIDNMKKYFPVVLLTAFAGDAERKVDDAFVVFDKDILIHEDKIEELIKKINITISNYKNKIKKTEQQIKELTIKQSKESLTDDEEDELIGLLIEMKKIDPESSIVPIHLLESKSLNNISEMLKTSKDMLKLLKRDNETQK